MHELFHALSKKSDTENKNTHTQDGTKRTSPTKQKTILLNTRSLSFTPTLKPTQKAQCLNLKHKLNPTNPGLELIQRLVRLAQPPRHDLHPRASHVLPAGQLPPQPLPHHKMEEPLGLGGVARRQHELGLDAVRAGRLLVHGLRLGQLPAGAERGQHVEALLHRAGGVERVLDVQAVGLGRGDELRGRVGGLVVDDGGGAQGLDVGVVPGAGGGVDAEAEEAGGLDGAGADAGGAAPDQHGFLVGGGVRGARGGDADGVEAAPGGGDGHGEEAGVVEGDVVRERGGVGGGDEGAGLEGAVVREALREEAGREGGDAGAGGEGRVGGGEDGAGDVGADDGGVVGDEEAIVAHVVVDWVEGDGVDGDEELVGFGGGGGGAGGQFEGRALGFENGGLVGGGHVGGIDRGGRLVFTVESC